MKTFFTLIPLVFLFGLHGCKKETEQQLPSFEADINSIHWVAQNFTATLKKVVYPIGPDGHFWINGSSNDGKAIYVVTRLDTVSTGTFREQAVTFLSFTTSRNIRVDNKIHLKWITGEEKNVKKFEIEESEDASNFIKIAEVIAVGNSSAPKTYTYDIKPALKSPFTDMVHYRLKAIDTDGRFNYTMVISTGFLTPATLVLQDDYSLGFDGQINVTAVDKVKQTVSGNFYFSYISDSTGTKMSVTNGSFRNIPYK